MSFSLSSLQADSVPFDLGDGEKIFFRSAKEFDLQEYAAWQRLNRSFQNIAKQRDKAKTEQQQAHVEKKNVKLCKEMVFLVLPDIPTAVKDNLTPSQFDSLAGMCINVASGRHSNQLVDEDDAVKIKDAYPDLPDGFVRGLSRLQASLLLPEPEEETPVLEGN